MFETPRLISRIGHQASLGLAVLTLGGCPVQQAPRNSQLNDNSASSANTNSADNREGNPDRPMPPIVVDTETNSSSSANANGSGDGAGGGGAGSGLALSVTAPESTLRLRLGAAVEARFAVVDSRGALSGLELLVFRDDNSDGIADGQAVLTQAIPAGDRIATLQTQALAGLLSNGAGRFLVGVRAAQAGRAAIVTLAPGPLVIDAEAPSAAWVAPDASAFVTRGAAQAVQILTRDSSTHTVRVQLDPDRDPANGNEFELVPATAQPPGESVRSFSAALNVPPGNYAFLVTVSDGVPPASTFYAGQLDAPVEVVVTNRLIGSVDLNLLADSSRGAILQGFNFNDLAGSSIVSVPDMNGDQTNELLIASRFGKPYIINDSGVGFGEAYLIYGGQNQRLRRTIPLNAVGRGNVPGLAIAGVRCPIGTTWTAGLSDVAVVDDMDGDDLPELVFSFPRVESVSLKNLSSEIQHPELMPDTAGLGALEYDAYYADGPGQDPRWHTNEAQFTRGGVVIVSSSTATLSDADAFNRKGNRVLDLLEVGQSFDANGLDIFTPLIRSMRERPGTQTTSCGNPPQPTEYEDWTILWDTTLDHQGPGGFYNRFTGPLEYVDPETRSFFPSLAPDVRLGLTIGFLDNAVPPITDPCISQCIRHNEWFVYNPCLPGTASCGGPAWHSSGTPTGDESQISVWTGFYGAAGVDRSPLTDAVGTRILGQRREDRFGASLGSDGTWLYISAPQRSALKTPDVPLLEADRQNSGVVYQLRTDNRTGPNSPTLTQLWVEPGTNGWPQIDAQDLTREDFTMPVPHQYIIEDIGYLRGRDLYWPGNTGQAEELDRLVTYSSQVPCDGPTITRVGGVLAHAVTDSPIYPDYSVGKAAYYVDRTPQIVGPHRGARISFVRGLGDLNGDGIRDFAVGSPDVQRDFTNPQAPSGPTVGGLFIVYGRTPGLEGDYLLDRMALNMDDPRRINGVYIKGADAGETLARVFADAGDVNGDGYADVIIGNEGAAGGAGEAIVLFGSPTLLSPGPNDFGGAAGGGWTPADIPAERAIRIRGAAPAELLGANVSSAGDVDQDGFADILVAAPGADGSRGAVYLIYGSANPPAVIDVSDLSPRNTRVPYAKFTGRRLGDAVGGGMKIVAGTDPNGSATTAFSQGLAPLGDIDGDGNADFAISAVLADPGGKADAGEVYILYGQSGP